MIFFFNQLIKSINLVKIYKKVNSKINNINACAISDNEDNIFPPFVFVPVTGLEPASVSNVCRRV